MSELIALNEKPFTNDEISVFDQKYLTLCENLANMTKQRKSLEEKETAIKAELGKAMDKYGIASLSNDYIKITRVAGSVGSKTIDLTKLEKNEPDLYADLLKDYPKTKGEKSASVRFSVN